MAEKRCSKCELTKPLGAFARDVSQSDGLRRMCRECASTYAREHRERGWEKTSIYRIIAVVAWGNACETCGSDDALDFCLAEDSLLVVREGDSLERRNARERLIARIARTGRLPDDALVLLCRGCRRAAAWVKPETKKCPTCHVVKSIDDYYVDRRKVHGRYAGTQTSCKICQGKRQRERKAQLRAARQAASRERQAVGA